METKKQPPNKRKRGILEKELNEIEASKLSDIEFKIMVIRMLKKLSDNYISMEKDIGIMNKNLLEMKNVISEKKNTLEGIKEG